MCQSLSQHQTSGQIWSDSARVVTRVFTDTQCEAHTHHLPKIVTADGGGASIAASSSQGAGNPGRVGGAPLVQLPQSAL
jgi:hypothetical protein